jgi:hypothetical protein
MNAKLTTATKEDAWIVFANIVSFAIFVMVRDRLDTSDA